MPVYEFLCRDCDARYDDLVGINDSLSDQACPTCTSSDVEKLVSSFRSKVASGGQTVQIDGSCLPGPASGGGRAGGCCGGGCAGC
jgi:putative FmdB family regulatory protein